MRAVWYGRTGPARDVLVAGEVPDPVPAAGEVRVRVSASGVNPRDVKRRAGAGDRVMTESRVIPGDDGAGTIDQVGPGVPASRAGQRVWVHSATTHGATHGAAHGWALGTAAEYVVVPSGNAIELPGSVSFEVGACLGVPALTAHRCVFADGPVDGATVLVTGGAGMVAHYAIELAKDAGATVLATASTPAKREAAWAAGADHVVDYRQPGAAGEIARLAGPAGVQRVVDVAFGANLPLTSAVIAVNGTIAAYGSDAEPRPELPFYPLMRRGVTIRTVLVFVMPEPARQAAIRDITRLLATGRLTHPVAARFPLAQTAAAHEYVEAGPGPGKVLIRP
jgi:NADPH2:quinone reductase